MPSIEQTLLARAYPYVLSARATEAVRHEAAKGCEAEIAPRPVALEPVYRPIYGLEELVSCGDSASLTVEAPLPEAQLRRLWIWVSPQQECNWNRSELFLKQLSHLQHRAALEVWGNQKRIALQILCHRDDVPVVRAAFSGQFERCTLSVAGANEIPASVPDSHWADCAFCDFYPQPPYSRLLTRPEELERSPYTTLLFSLAQIPSPAVGFYQVVFIPVGHHNNWHQNIRALVDLEYKIKQMNGLVVNQRYPEQAPSVALQRMAMDVEERAHNDKPFFAAAMRVGVLHGQEQAESLLRTVAVVGGLIQYGGRPLNALTSADYQPHLTRKVVRDMFFRGLVYRPGFLVNSEELTSLVHIPPPAETEQLQPIMSLLETLPAAEASAEGTPIGVCLYADARQPVCVPRLLRAAHTHAIGGTGMGKSTMLEPMMLYDMHQSHGLALLDPHGTLVQRMLCLIPEEYAERVIYVDPGDPDWVPIWNPLHCGVGMSRSRIADDLIHSFKSFFTGWGHRLEHLLRHAFFAILHLPEGSLLDVSNLLRKKSPESRQLRDELLQVLDNEVARLFWRDDFDGYGPTDLTPPQHKLSQLLASETVGAMLSQGGSAFSFREIMDDGKILLVDLSNIGSEVRDILGSFMLSLLHLTALARSKEPNTQRRPYHLFVDEAHRFLTDAMEDTIAETRKFGVSLTLAHQYMSQFNTRKTDALSGVGSTIIFRVDRNDAQHLEKDLQGKVTREDMSTLDVGQAIARIGNHIVRVRTNPPLDIPKHHFRDRIIARSHQLYCRPIHEVQREIRERYVRRGGGALIVGPTAQTRTPAARSEQVETPQARRTAASENAGEFGFDTF